MPRERTGPIVDREEATVKVERYHLRLDTCSLNNNFDITVGVVYEKNQTVFCHQIDALTNKLNQNPLNISKYLSWDIIGKNIKIIFLNILLMSYCLV
jgi:hypothetical protein